MAASAASACNPERKQQCDALLAAMKPLSDGMPTSSTVEAVQKQIAAMTFQDQPLGIYAKNYGATLAVLASTLKLQEGPSAPDGTADVVKEHLKKARTNRDDVQRYCSE